MRRDTAAVLAVILGALVVAVVAAVAFGLARGGGGDGVEVGTPTGASGTATGTATAMVTSTARPGVSPTAGAGTPASSAARLVALNGMRCVGQWRNSTQGTSGAFATRLEAGGSGGAISFEVGGPVFGASGGTFEAPFRLAGDVMEIEATSDFLGRMSARVGLDGTATGTLRAVPALGADSVVTVSDYTFAENRLAFQLRIEPGAGRPVQSAAVEAACSR